jgi:hypothetical protein
MGASIQWRLMFRVSSHRALDKCLARTLPLFGAGVEVGECKPYWKIPELWECNLVSLIAATSPAEQVLACLLTAKSLASRWYILGFLSAESADGFSGVFDAKGQGGASGPAVGLEWASFRVGTCFAAEPHSWPTDLRTNEPPETA